MNDGVTTGNPAVMFLLLSCVMAIIILSCAGTEPTAFERDTIVLEGNLITGKPVTDIRLSYVQPQIYDSVVMNVRNPYTDELIVDSVLYMLNTRWLMDAEVTINGNGKFWPLAYSDSGYYYDPGGECEIASGQTYRIDIYDAAGRHAWAETTVPQPVSNLSLSHNTLYVDTTGVGSSSSGSGSGRTGRSGSAKKSSGSSSRGDSSGIPPSVDTTTSSVPDSLSKVIIKWDNPDDSYMYFHYERETEPVPGLKRGFYTCTCGLIISTTRAVSSGSSGGSSGSGGGAPLCGTLSRTLTMKSPGSYKLFVCSPPSAMDYWNNVAVNPDTSSAIQDRWTRAYTNVKGGVGYFASFGVDSVNLTVVPWSAQ